MNKSVIVTPAVIVDLLAAAGGLYLRNQVQPQAEVTSEALPTPTNNPVVTESPTPTSAVMEKVEIKFTDTGFEPKAVTIKKGTAVTFTNDSARTMWVASAPHPTHTDYPEFDQKATGNEYVFIFDKVGAWKFHNHNPFVGGGVITVTE